MSQQIPEVQVAQLAAELPDDLVVLDVREPAEWVAGHIDGATHMPMMTVPERLAEIPHDQQILVVCKVGSRSAQVTAYLGNTGREAFNLAGGMIAWTSAGRPMVAETEATPRVL